MQYLFKHSIICGLFFSLITDVIFSFDHLEFKKKIIMNDEIPLVIDKKITSIAMTDPHLVLQMYQLMKDVHELFEFFEIPYWVSFGTLLGTVRHEGIIGWDDDLDICIDVSSVKRLEELLPFLKQLGYTLYKMDWGYKIFPIDGPICPAVPYTRYPFIDIFITYNCNGKVTCDDAIWRDPFLENDILPLKKYKFGSFLVLGPANPIPLLNDLYGSWWAYVGNNDRDHIGIKPANPGFFRLPPESYTPAQPLGPLEDRTNALNKISLLSESHKDRSLMKEKRHKKKYGVWRR